MYDLVLHFYEKRIDYLAIRFFKYIRWIFTTNGNCHEPLTFANIFGLKTISVNVIILEIQFKLIWKLSEHSLRNFANLKILATSSLLF